MSRTNFRYLCCFGLSLFVFAGYAIFTIESRLPPELSSYLEAEYQQEPAIIEWVLGLFAIAALVANVGFLFFAKWARPVFAISIIVTTAGTIFSGPLVQSALETAICEVSMVIDGMLIALVYFSGVKNEFNADNS